MAMEDDSEERDSGGDDSNDSNDGAFHRVLSSRTVRSPNMATPEACAGFLFLSKVHLFIQPLRASEIRCFRALPDEERRNSGAGGNFLKN